MQYRASRARLLCIQMTGPKKTAGKGLGQGARACVRARTDSQPMGSCAKVARRVHSPSRYLEHQLSNFIGHPVETAPRGEPNVTARLHRHVQILRRSFYTFVSVFHS